MFKIGDPSSKAPAVFGIVSLLAPKTPVYYDSVFTTQSVGRVSDLIAAQLRKSGLDELRLRALLLFSVFEGYRSEATQGEALARPLVLECATDDDKVVLGISFRKLSVKEASSVEGLGERLVSAVPRDSFEELLRELYLQSDHLVLRYASDVGRFEVISVLSLKGKVVTKPKPEVVRVGSAEALAPQPASETYIQLADTDYAALLKESSAVRVRAETPLGAMIARVSAGRTLQAQGVSVAGGAAEAEEQARISGMAPQQDDASAVGGGAVPQNDRVTVAGGPLEAEQKSHVRGGPADAETRNVVSGSADSVDSERIVVGGAPQDADVSITFKGAKGDRAESDRMLVGGNAGDPNTERFLVSEGSPESSAEQQQREHNYQSRIAQLEAQLSTLRAATGQAPRSVGGGLASLLKRTWPFRSRKTTEQAEGTNADQQPAVPAAPVPEAMNADGAPVLAGAAASPPAAGAAASTPAQGVADGQPDYAGQLAEAIQNGELNRVVHRAQEQAKEIRAELTSNRAKVFVDGVMGEIVSEKARLQDLAKQVSLSVRQKEHHFKTREHMLQEELRRKEEVIRQRDMALSRMKEQLSEINMTLERTKAGPKGSADPGHYKHKYTMTQKMLLTTKEENSQLKSKVEDMRSQLLSAQAISKTASLPQAELSALRIKHERTARQLEDLKRQNRQLMDKLNETKKDRTIAGGSVEDLKRKLESANKMLNVQMKDTEQLKLQVEELKREEARLKAELARIQKPGSQAA